MSPPTDEPTPQRGSEPGLGADGEAVWRRMCSVYDGFLASDAAGIDAVMSPDVTLWDSAEPELVVGLDGLAALRARRPDAAPAPSVLTLEASDPRVDVWGDVALLRHVLRVTYDDDSVEVVRNTSVWRRARGEGEEAAGEWLAVHNHEDVIGGI